MFAKELTKRGAEVAMITGLITMPANADRRLLSGSWDSPISISRPTFSTDVTIEPGENTKKKKFETLAKQWRRETRNCSSLAQRYSHDAYRKILVMGPQAIPWILSELKVRPDRWFSALADLAEYYEIGPEHSFESAVEAWLEWGRKNDYNV